MNSFLDCLSTTYLFVIVSLKEVNFMVNMILFEKLLFAIYFTLNKLLVGWDFSPLQILKFWIADLTMISMFRVYLRSCGKTWQVLSGSLFNCIRTKLFLSFLRDLHHHLGRGRKKWMFILLLFWSFCFNSHGYEGSLLPSFFSSCKS